MPTRVLALAFLLLLGLAVAATAEITGALLVFALLVTPAATAQQITARPGPGLALSVALALAVTWLGLAIAYFSPYPVGFWVTSLSFGLYVAVRLAPLARLPAPAGGGGRLMLAHEFMRNAFLAGTFVALACGLVRLLRRPAQPGIRRRRPQPRRLHRRPRRSGGWQSTSGSVSSPRRSSSRLGWGCSASGRGPTTS